MQKSDSGKTGSPGISTRYVKNGSTDRPEVEFGPAPDYLLALLARVY